MPRYDDCYGNTRLYVGRLSSRTRTRDLERLFSRYGRARDVDMKLDYAFVESRDPRDADDARHYLDGRDIDGSRITVEASRGAPCGSRDHGVEVHLLVLVAVLIVGLMVIGPETAQQETGKTNVTAVEKEDTLRETAKTEKSKEGLGWKLLTYKILFTSPHKEPKS